ncbi:TlpA family protein disulfide reductase [Spirillospora sp. CA-294931]|uniref:TlpA family protein disulfide reductase n=1 Tax=Spirillospora sp. CA-294931 TaxID=3240042 RepID=UPI003D8D3585
MTYSAATVTVIGVLSLVNIALTLGVVRRLGDLQRRPAPGLGGSGAEAPPMTVKPGAKVGDFQVTAVDGTTVSRAGLKGPTLVAFLAPGCQACDFSVPAFIERAEGAPGGRDGVLAVVMGAPQFGDELRERLAPMARVLTEEEEGGPLVTAFGVIGLPAFGMLSDDRLVASHPLPERLPAAA